MDTRHPGTDDRSAQKQSDSGERDTLPFRTTPEEVPPRESVYAEGSEEEVRHLEVCGEDHQRHFGREGEETPSWTLCLSATSRVQKRSGVSAVTKSFPSCPGRTRVIMNGANKYARPERVAATREATYGSNPPEHEESGEEDVQNELPPQRPVRVHEHEEDDRGR